MKRSFLFLFMLCICCNSFLFSQSHFHFAKSEAKEGFSIIQNTRSSAILRHTIVDLSLEEVNYKDAEGEVIILSGIYLPSKAGTPNLPADSKFIAIPTGSKAKLKINKSQTEIIKDVDLLPAAVPQLDNDRTPAVHQKDMEIYGKDAFYPENPFVISDVMTIRGVEMIIVSITPFQYNPISKELLVYHDIEFEITTEGGNGTYGIDRYRTREWDQLLSDMIFNHDVLPKIDYDKRKLDHARNRESGSEYVIITPDNADFTQLADSIKLFRTQQGISTKVVTVSECGGNNETAIRNYIRNAYNTWDTPPAGVLLLGDHNTDGTLGIVSCNMNNHPGGEGYNPYISDNRFGDMNNDDLPDVVIGRITGRNYEELYHMINKDLSYERTPPTNPDFYDKPITAMGFQLERWFQICSEVVNGFWEHGLGKHPVRQNAIYEGTPGSNWSSNEYTPYIVNYFGPSGTGYIPSNMSHLTEWDANSNTVNAAINSGAFIIQHRDHGAEELWGEPGYSIASIKKLHNNDLTFVMSSNCLTGKFNYSGPDGCFAEVFHRHQQGALGLIAATEVSYSFVNDVYVWGVYDNMWPDFMPTYGTEHPTNFVRPAFGNAAGKFFLAQSSWVDSDWLKPITYYLFHHHGDVFMNLYTEIPQNLNVELLPVLVERTDHFELKADAGALICMSVDGEIIGTAEATGEPQSISIIPQEVNADIILTITKQNYYRYSRKIAVMPSTGPYLIFSDVVIDDQNGNNNQRADYDETCKFNLSLHNTGFEGISQVKATLTSASPYVEIIKGETLYEKIEANQIANLDQAFEVYFSDSTPDQCKINFNIELTNSDFSFQDQFQICVDAPSLKIIGSALSDENGNPTDRLMANQTSNITFIIENKGHSLSKPTRTNLQIFAPFVEIDENNLNGNSIEADATDNITFRVFVPENISEGYVLNYQTKTIAEKHETAFEGTIPLGYSTENFESEELNSAILWSNTGTKKWIIDETDAFEGERCFKSAPIDDNKSSQFIIGFDFEIDDKISFYHKVSSEANDKLYFYINNKLVDEWSNESEWERSEFEIKKGQSLFKFVYKKDESGNAGEDCAKIDFINLPPKAKMILFAGNDTKICPNEAFQTSAYASNCSSIEWSSNGDGAFNDVSIQNPTYTVGPSDIANGAVTLVMKGVSSIDETEENSSLTISMKPTLETASTTEPIGDTLIDLRITNNSLYHTEIIEGATTYEWNLSPEEAGTLINDENSVTVSWSPIFRGKVSLSVKAVNDCGESEESASLIRVINSTGINESEISILRVFPNPAKDKLYFTVTEEISKEYDIRIFNSLGIKVMEKHLPSENKSCINELDISALNCGTYLFNLTSSEQNISIFILVIQ